MAESSDVEKDSMADKIIGNYQTAVSVIRTVMESEKPKEYQRIV